MAVTYDPTTSAGRVRLLSGDVPNDDDEAILTDGDIAALLDLRDDNVTLAAASALRAIAASEVLLAKAIRLQDIETDGPAVGRELRLQADVLEKQADTDFDLGWAPMVNDTFSWRERLLNERRRANG